MTADTIGGVWTYAMELARALEPHGVEILLATMGAPAAADQRAQAATRPNLQLAESTYKLEWMDEPWSDVDRAGEWLLTLTAAYAPDVMHLNGYAHAALVWPAPVIVVAHSCVRTWWKAVKSSDAPESWAEYTQRVRAGLEAADLVIAPTAAMLDGLREQYGHVGACEVIPNGRALPSVNPNSKGNLVFSAGRLWDEAKNISALARVAPRLPWPVAIAGEVEFSDGSSIITRDGVSWLGRLSGDDTTSWMGRASVFVLPARYEPFGLSALEAGLSGCALVLGDVASLREVWSDAALYVNPDDDEELASVTTALCRDGPRRRKLADHARCRAAELTPSVMAARYFASYSRVIEGRRVAEVASCAS